MKVTKTSHVSALLSLALVAGLTFNTVFGYSFVAAQTAPSQLSNAGFETAGATATEATGWSPFHGGYQRVSTAHTGSWGIRLTSDTTGAMAGAYQRIDLNQTAVTPVFIGGFVKGENIQTAAGAYFGASIYAEIHMNDGSVAYWNSLLNRGTFDWRWIGFNTGNLPLVTKPISYIFIVPIIAQSTGTAYFDDISVTQQTPTQGIVTVMFDDGKLTDYTVAKPILDQSGFKATSAVITEDIGAEGSMSSAQLTELKNSGWEIISHSVTHRDLTTLSAAEQEQELRASKDTLVALGHPSEHFALPFGAYNADILDIGANYYTSIRSYEQGSNPKGTFPYELKVRGVLDSTTMTEVQSWINEAVNGKRWVIITFHDIAETGDDAYHVSPARFQEIITAVENSNVQVMTYGQALNAFKVSPSTSGGTTTPPPPPPPPPEEVCNAETSVTASFASDPNTVQIKNASANCSFTVGIASYKKYDSNIENQTLHDSESATIAPNATISLSVTLPSCAYQFDAFYGNVVTSFEGGVRYGDRLLANRHRDTPLCSISTPPAASSTSSVSTSTSSSSSSQSSNASQSQSQSSSSSSSSSSD